MGEATLVVNELWMWMCGLANSDSFHQKNQSLKVKVKKLVKPVIDVGKEFQILGHW